MRIRRVLAVVGSLAFVASLTVGPAGASVDFVKVACSLPHDQLLRIWHGTELDRSGDIIIVAKEPNFVGSNFPHSGPWDYLQRVPMLWYGPGIIPAKGVVKRPVTSADIAPTEAAMLHFDAFHAPDGTPMSEALPTNGKIPRLIVTFVWDAGGRDVLDAYPKDWPVLKSLIPKGVWFENATVGSSPSITPATHSTIGTGAFPMRTGQVDAEFRVGPNLLRSGELGPQLLDYPTFADIYDRAMGNKPIVGDLASVNWHLNMMGHGSLFSGGDKDIAVLRAPAVTASNEGTEGTSWHLPGADQPWYTFPSYVNNLPPLSSYTRKLDQADGKIDQKWRQDDIQQLEGGWATPARVPYQDTMVDEVIKREHFGKDDVPDLLFENNKVIDHISHLFSVNSVEMQDTLHWQDAGLSDLIRTLNADVGRGKWAMVLTADHGAQFNPKVSGAFQVTPTALQSDLEARFGNGDSAHPAIQGVRTSQIFLNLRQLQQNGYSVEDVASFVLNYTKGQATSDPSTLPAGTSGDKIFAAVFPSSVFAKPLPCLPEMKAA